MCVCVSWEGIERQTDQRELLRLCWFHNRELRFSIAQPRPIVNMLELAVFVLAVVVELHVGVGMVHLQSGVMVTVFLTEVRNHGRHAIVSRRPSCLQGSRTMPCRVHRGYDANQEAAWMRDGRKGACMVHARAQGMFVPPHHNHHKNHTH